MRRFGFSSVTTVPGAMLDVIQAFEPITAPLPITVSPPRIVAFA